MTKKPEEPQRQTLYTPAEVANFFRVDPKTVTRWARTGTLTPVMLPSGHRRYRADEIHRLLNVPVDEQPEPEPEPSARALAVLHGVIRDYFGGDPAAVVRFLRKS
ncbi:helix-turn-helix domain-containing protein [Actinomadura rayongensis]|uniref:Helix-turn-helix domain-containing protein n=1 Tax=Actinomadura rayongensis TaxID=1429076 RepID=A0A6I4W3D8_9ACTN|nr:helix-turn-helix domain-containing protein [Actinomadura rayongensis]